MNNELHDTEVFIWSKIYVFFYFISKIKAEISNIWDISKRKVTSCSQDFCLEINRNIWQQWNEYRNNRHQYFWMRSRKTIVSNIIYFNFVKVQMYTNLNILVLERQRFHQETSKAVYFFNKPVELGITFTSFIV